MGTETETETASVHYWAPRARAAPSFSLSVEGFDGPFDLLLHLVEQGRLDVTRLSLAAVADQFCARVRMLVAAGLEELAGFLVVAAHLLVLKSRALLPGADAVLDGLDGLGQDAEELERRLLEYRGFRTAASALAARHDAGWLAYIRVAAPPLPPPAPPERLVDVGPDALAAAVQRLMATPRQGPVELPQTDPPRMTLRQRMGQILAQLRQTSSLSLGWLMPDGMSRGDVVITFLAALELCNSRRVGLQQDALFGDIWLTIRRSAPGAGE